MKKILSIFMALLIVIMPLCPEIAQGASREKTIKDSLEYIDGKIEKIGKTNAKNLLNTIEDLQKQNVVNIFFQNINKDMKNRLENIGIEEQSISAAMTILRREKYLENTVHYIDDKNSNYSNWLSETYEKIYEVKDAPLKEFNNYVLEKYGSRRKFLIDIKALEVDAQGNIKFEYHKNNKTVKVTEIGDFLEKINDKLRERQIGQLTSTDLDSLVSAANKVFTKFDEKQAENIKDTLEKLQYNVKVVPAVSDDSGGSDDSGSDDSGSHDSGSHDSGSHDSGSDSGGGSSSSSGGGGGGGGGESSSRNKEPFIDKPSKSEDLVTIKVPANNMNIKKEKEDSKAIVTIDEKAVEKTSELIDKADEKYEDENKILLFNFISKDIGESTEIKIPAGLLNRAFKKDFDVKLNMENIAIEVPSSAISLAKTYEVIVDLDTEDSRETLKEIQLQDSMKTISKAQKIAITTRGRKTILDKPVTLRFDLKGLNTNIDKLGAYLIDKKAGTVEFVSGKINKQKNEVVAETKTPGTFILMEYDKTFKDIKGHWAQNYIESMASKFIINGRSEDIFMPNDHMTRAEFAKIIVRALEIETKSYKDKFQDVKAQDWYADYVQTAYSIGLIKGREEGIFDPNAEISRQEMMAIIGRALGEKSQKSPDKQLSQYKDGKEVAGYAKKFVSLLLERGIIGGYPDSTIRPKAKITRAEASKIIYGFYSY